MTLMTLIVMRTLRIHSQDYVQWERDSYQQEFQGQLRGDRPMRYRMELHETCGNNIEQNVHDATRGR